MRGSVISLVEREGLGGGVLMREEDFDDGACWEEIRWVCTLMWVWEVCSSFFIRFSSPLFFSFTSVNLLSLLDRFSFFDRLSFFFSFFPLSSKKNPKLSVKSLVAFPVLVNLLPPLPPSPPSISFNNAKRRQISENFGRLWKSIFVQS